MVYRKLQAIIAITLIISIGYSCKKNKQEPTEVYNPTAYNLQYPDFVTSNIGLPTNPTDNALTNEGVSLGKKLFFENMLSKDMTLNCGSCHGQHHAFDDSNQFSKGVNGSLGGRNAMPIINMAWANRFFWDGRRNSLEGQAHDPVANPIEMANTWPVVVSRLQKDASYPALFFKAFGARTIDSNLVVKAIAQFERTMISFNSRFDAYEYTHTGVLEKAELRGYEVFQRVGCANCHTYGLFTDGSFRNNGLDIAPVDSGLSKFTRDAADYGKFKVPTLRNIALTAPYMHDGRFPTLQAVLGFYTKSVQQGSPNLDSNMHRFTAANAMTRQEQDDVVAYLNTLTDSTFITDARFSNQ